MGWWKQLADLIKPLAEGKQTDKGQFESCGYSALEAVVYCKDCRWRNTKACFCKARKDVQDRWFCSEGEKADG